MLKEKNKKKINNLYENNYNSYCLEEHREVREACRLWLDVCFSLLGNEGVLWLFSEW